MFVVYGKDHIKTILIAISLFCAVEMGLIQYTVNVSFLIMCLNYQ